MFSDLHERLKNTRNEAIKNIDDIQADYLAEERQELQNKPLEEKLYREFVRCNRNKKFIDISHIEALGVPYDVLIVTSIKNTGKNVGIIYKAFDLYAKAGKKVLFLRTSQKEIIESLSEYNNSDANPFYFRNHGKILTAFHKKTGEITGLFKDFKFCNAGSGGEFKDFGAIIYDECCSWDPRNTLNRNHYLNWAALISSVTRNKEDGVKIFCLGNLMGMNMGLLDFYGISRDDNLRYIKRFDPINPNNVCNILYINANNIYEGIKAQVGAVQGMAPEFKHQLFKNKCDLNNQTIITPKDWDLFESLSSFIIVKISDKTKWLFEMKKTPGDRFSKSPTLFALRCRPWEPYYNINGPIYTDSYIIQGSCSKTTYVPDLDEDIFFLYECAGGDYLRFYDLNTQNALLELFKNIDPTQKYAKGF